MEHLGPRTRNPSAEAFRTSRSRSRVQESLWRLTVSQRGFPRNKRSSIVLRVLVLLVVTQPVIVVAAAAVVVTAVGGLGRDSPA